MAVDVEPRDTARAVEALARDKGQALVALAYVLSGNSEDAQDCVQSVLLRLLDRGVADHVVDLASYARRAVVNEFLDRNRSRTRLRAALTLLLPTFHSSSHDLPDIRLGERDLVVRAVKSLPGRARAAVVLRYYSGLPDAQIAEALGCAPGTVRSLISRSMPKLRAQLDASRTSSGAAEPERKE